LVVATDRFHASNLATPTDLVGIVLDPAEPENCDRGPVVDSHGVADAYSIGPMTGVC
jgi:hypothetical protein